MSLIAENFTTDFQPSNPMELQLDLVVNDPDIIGELLKHSDVNDRSDFALAALKVGVLAIRQASGVLDSRAIHEECNRFVKLVGSTLSDHTLTVSNHVGSLLSKFFDPANGEFNQRIERLICRDGELESLLSKHLNGDGSLLAQTLERHIGSNSPLFQMLSPDQRRGILAALKETFELVLGEHGKVISRQFSLDDKESALSRLIVEITEKNGILRHDLAGDFDHIRREFSLDNESGALARLMGRVEGAHRTILKEFSADNEQSALCRMTKLLENTNMTIGSSLSLDKEDSPLSRLRRELLSVFNEMDKTNKTFQEQVHVTLKSLETRRAEAARSTSHGLDFEGAVGDFIQREAQRCGDLFVKTSEMAGSISRCKIGDFVVTLSPDTGAPRTNIVIEAKENKSYTIKGALDEIKTARENRHADVGVFVLSKTSAPSGIEPLNRWGQDIVVVWDGQDAATDVYLKAAISMARFIVVQESKASKETTVSISEMDAAIGTLTRDIALLDDVTRLAQTVKNNGESIVSKADSLKKKVEKQLDILREHITAMRSVTSQ